MKILLVLPFLPYPGAKHAGGKISYYLLRTLAERHEVHLASRVFPGEEKHIPFLRVMLAGLEIVPTPSASVSSDTKLFEELVSFWRLARLARKALAHERFDVCQVEWTLTGLFWRSPRSTPAVITLIDVAVKPARRRYVAARGLERITAWGKMLATRFVEGLVVSKFQQVFTLSEEDGRWAHGLYPLATVQVLKYPAGLEFSGLTRREVPNRLLFLGDLKRELNIEAIQWFVDGCLPLIRREIPDVEFHIVGQGLAESQRIQWSKEPDIRVIGEVESIEKHYKEAAVFVAPILIGGGVIVKILDGLAAGVPVVTTTRGNEVVLAEDGKAILIADTPELFAAMVVRLLQSSMLRQALGRCGQEHVQRAFSPAGFVETLEQTYTDLTQPGRSIAAGSAVSATGAAEV